MLDLIENVTERYKHLDSRRQGVLERKRRCAALTLPHLLPPSGHKEDDALDEPYQSEGASGINTMAAKMLLALYPTDTSFYKETVSEDVLQEFQQASPQAREEVEKALQKNERIVQEDISSNAMRPVIYETFRYLLGTGDSCTFIPDKGKIKSFRPDRFVVVRDDQGNMAELIIKESFDPRTLPKAQRELAEETQAIRTSDSTTADAEEVDVYTYVKLNRDEEKVYSAQYIGDQLVPGTDGSYPMDSSPWIVPRWTAVEGENYGRGLAEEMYGSLNSLENLMMSVILTTGIGAKTLFLVDPAGITKPKKLADASIGDFVVGREKDVTALKVDKVQDLQAALTIINDLKKELRTVFLRNSAIQRQGERVTAEEIRFLADELETAHGGAYSRLTDEFQRPFLNRIRARLIKQNKIKALPSDIVKLRIVTGIEALGRGNDLAKLERGVASISQIPNAIGMLHTNNLIDRIFLALGVDTTGLVKTQEELQAEQQQAMAQQMMASAAAPVAGQLAKGAVEAQRPQSQ